MPLTPPGPDPATALTDLARASRKGTWVSVPMHGVTASVSLRVSQTDEGFQIQRRFSGCFGGSTTTMTIRYADLKNGLIVGDAAQALQDLHEAMQPQPLRPVDPAPPPTPMPTWPGGNLPGRFPSRPTDRGDLIQAAWQGMLHDRRGNSISVSLTQTGYQIQVIDRFGQSPTRFTQVDWQDLERGRVTAQQRLALDMVHQALDDQRIAVPDNGPPGYVPDPTPVGPWPPASGNHAPPGTSPDREAPDNSWPRLQPLPGGLPGGNPSERVVVRDVDARLRDLEAGLKRGYMGSTGCTSPGGALEVKKTADGFTLKSSSGGFITHRHEVTISLADLRKGTLTREQVDMLDRLRRLVAEPQGGKVLF
jgi:hypothetical protein